MLDETFDPPVTESRTEFRDSGVDVGRVEPGEVVRIDGGRAYVLGGSRGLVAATKTGDGYSMREYVYAEQATPDNYSNPDIDMLESTRPEGMNINLSHDPDTPGYSRAHKFAPALYDSEVSPTRRRHCASTPVPTSDLPTLGRPMPVSSSPPDSAPAGFPRPKRSGRRTSGWLTTPRLSRCQRPGPFPDGRANCHLCTHRAPIECLPTSLPVHRSPSTRANPMAGSA